MAELQLEILTPFGVAYSDQIDDCIVPGLLGQFQVMKDHAEMLAAIGVGMITVHKHTQKKYQLATSGGYCEVDRNKIKLIVESAELAEKIDVNRAQQAKARAEKRIRSSDTDMDMDRARLALIRALNRIKVAELIK